MKSRRYPFFAICVDDTGFEGSLQRGKVYEVIRPEPGDRNLDFRVIDEEGEDYLYPARRFVRVQLPPRARQAVKKKGVAWVEVSNPTHSARYS